MPNLPHWSTTVYHTSLPLVYHTGLSQWSTTLSTPLTQQAWCTAVLPDSRYHRMHRSLAASTPEGANTTHRHIISLHLQSLITLYCPRLKQLSEVSNQHRLAENGRKAQRTSEQLRRFIYLLLQIHKRVQGKPTVASGCNHSNCCTKNYSHPKQTVHSRCRIQSSGGQEEENK